MLLVSLLPGVARGFCRRLAVVSGLSLRSLRGQPSSATKRLVVTIQSLKSSIHAHKYVILESSTNSQKLFNVCPAFDH